MNMIDHNLSTRARSSNGAAGVFDAVDGSPKVSIKWNDALFHAINRLARKNRTSFAHEVRRLVALGLSKDA